MRCWICCSERKTRGGLDAMGSVGVEQPRTPKPDMNVSARRLAGNRVREGIERNLAGFEIAHQPLPFLQLWIHRYIDAAAMIEPQGSMNLGVPIGADGKRFVEPLGEGQFDGL